jgi:hypothetical protein
MLVRSSSTSWRDQPIFPENYQGVAHLVAIARKARGRMVDFNWVFTRGDLLRLRHAVYEWGSGVTGRYRCFDAQVVAAINAVLDDTVTALVLMPPKNSTWAGSEVTALTEGELFRLRGHAPFDILFGYGVAGLGADTPAKARLGPGVAVVLATSVGMLGWDLSRLQGERFRPVLNALYGNALSFGVTHGEPSAEPPIELTIEFTGPLSVLNHEGAGCLFTEEAGKRSGIYLWTLPVKGRDLPWYIGQTRRGFAQRMGEHIGCFLSGQYTTWDAAALAEGENRRVEGSVIGWWPETLPAFLSNYEQLVPHIVALLRNLRVHVAPLTGDAHLHNRVEGAIGRYLKGHPETELRDFFFPGMRVPAAIPFDRPLRLQVNSTAPVAGLPADIRE